MTREFRYLLMDPTGNRTILVETDVPAEFQPFIGEKLMKLEPTAEQAGFLSAGNGCDISLRMAGGEFCGNAAMSAAVYCGVRNGLRQGRVTMSVSGEPDPVTAEVKAGADGVWQGCVKMPRPRSVEMVSFPDGQTFPLVSFQGIAHVIVEQDMPEKEAEQVIRSWCAHLHADALGLMFVNLKEERLKPLVYVPAADTLFWESACGSGTAAVGAWLASESGKTMSVSLRQPGGGLGIKAYPDGSLYLKGTVRCLYEKTAVLELPAGTAAGP